MPRLGPAILPRQRSTTAARARIKIGRARKSRPRR